MKNSQFYKAAGITVAIGLGCYGYSRVHGETDILSAALAINRNDMISLPPACQDDHLKLYPNTISFTQNCREALRRALQTPTHD